MKILVIKMSSMGDILHTLPALTDAKQAIPNLQVDWVVEPKFADIPRWHPAVNNVITLPLRQWRRQPWQMFKQKQWQTFISTLRAQTYDYVIDAQGLIKSAVVTRLARGKRAGHNYQSAREKWSALAYRHTTQVCSKQHAVLRMRQLFSQLLDYSFHPNELDYGIDQARFKKLAFEVDQNALLFFHGTTWSTKHWPQQYWETLAMIASQAGFDVLLPWGNEQEKQNAQQIQAYVRKQGLCRLPQILPKLELSEFATLLSQVKGAVAVDTGLGHMAAALAVPTVSLYGPTDPNLTGAMGNAQVHLKASLHCAPCLAKQCQFTTQQRIHPPCFNTVSPVMVWQSLLALLKSWEKKVIC